MKTYILSLGIALLAFAFTTDYSSNNDGCCKKSECCKNCTDECKEKCITISKMSEEEKKSEEGKALIAECKELCTKNDCCKAKDAKSCEHNKKGCCSHK